MLFFRGSLRRSGVRRSLSPRRHRPGSRVARRATIPGLLGERLEPRQLLASDMVAVAGGTLPTTSYLEGTQVSAFQIAKYEVTWSEWQEVRTWSAAQGRTYDLGSVGTGAAALNPVEYVNWYDAVKWCNAKSEKDGFEPVYSANGGVYRSGEFGMDGSGTVMADGSKNGYRLPDRSEWEWAARGGANSKGFTYSGSNTVSDVAWYLDNSDGDTKAVGTKAANELGLYDMSGNVKEWCWNDFTDAPFSQGSFSFLNGGSVYENEFLCTFDNIGLEMDPNVRLFGLRLARNATSDNNAPTGISLSAATVAENDAVGATIGTLSTTDADAGDTFTYERVTGTGSTDNGSFTIAGNKLQAAASFNFEAKSSYTVRVRSTDRGGLSTEKAFTISVTNVNEAPTVSAPPQFTVTEDVAGNLVWPASTVIFADVDSPTLTVVLGATFGTLTVKPAAGITLGSDVLGKTFAGTPATLNAYFQTSGNILYTPPADDDRDISLLFFVFDGTAYALAPGQIAITPVNDAPTAIVPAAFTVQKNVATNLVWRALGFEPFADIDSDSLTITLAIADGTLTAKPGPGITIGGTATARTLAGTASDLSAYLLFPGNVQYTTKLDNTVARTLTTTVSDGALSTSKTSTVSINAFAPTATAPASFTVTEDAAGNLVWPASPAPFADVDSTSLSVTLAVTDGSLTAVPAAGITLDGPATGRMFTGTIAALNGYFKTAGNIKYTPAANNTVARTLKITVSDGMLSSSKTSTISIKAVNDAPTVVSPVSFTVTEDVAGNLVWPASPAPFADVDSTSLTVTLSVADGTLSAATVAGITFGGTAKARTFAGTAAALNGYFKTAGNVKYTPAANNTVARTLTTTVSDRALSASQTSTISITPVNDAPTVSAPTSFRVTEDVAGNLVWPTPPAPFADVDSPSLTVTLSVADGTLTAATVAGITLGGTATASTFAGTPAALSSYFKNAGNIKYTTAADNTAARTLTTTVSDGVVSASKTSTISITPVNDAPTIWVWAAFGFATYTGSIARISEEPSGGNANDDIFNLDPAWKFGDADNDQLTATFTIDGKFGKLSVRPLTAQEQALRGVTIKGGVVGNTLSFSGKAAALERFFRDGNNVFYTYTGLAGIPTFRLLTASVTDGKSSSSTASWIEAS